MEEDLPQDKKSSIPQKISPSSASVNKKELHTKSSCNKETALKSPRLDYLKSSKQTTLKSPRADETFKPSNSTVRPKSPRWTTTGPNEPVKVIMATEKKSDKYMSTDLTDAPQIQIPIVSTNSRYDTVTGLVNHKKNLLYQVDVVDTKLQTMSELRSILRKFSTKMKEFSAAIFKLDRNRQGVPYVANVKALFTKVHDELNGDVIKNYVKRMNSDDVPFVAHMNVQLKNLNKLCQNILVHHVHYHVTYLEDFHLVAGKLRGMMKTVIVLYLTDHAAKDDILDQSFDDILLGDEVGDQATDDSDNDDQLSSRFNGTSPRKLLVTSYLDDETESIQDADTITKFIVTIQELENVRKLFKESNSVLGNILRLSLGNPQIQSLRDYFAMIGDVLSRADFTITELNDIPFVQKIEATIAKMIRMSNLKRPSEKHVEQMKILLGELDGRVMIIAKNLAT